MERLLDYCKNLFSCGIDKYKFTFDVFILNCVLTGFLIPALPLYIIGAWLQAVELCNLLLLIFNIVVCIYFIIFSFNIVARIRDSFSDNVIFCSVVVFILVCFLLSPIIPFGWLLAFIITIALMCLNGNNKQNKNIQKKYYILFLCINLVLSFIAIMGMFFVAYQIMYKIKEPARRYESEQQQMQQYAAHGRRIGNLYISKMPVKDKKTVGKTIANLEKACTEVGMRMPTLEDFEYISENLYSGDVDSLSDADFRKFSSHEMQENLQWLSNWDGDYLTYSVGSDGENIIYNMKIDNNKTCRFITLSRNAYEWSAVDTCIRHSVVEKPYSYSVSPHDKTNPEKSFRTICVSD